MKLHWNHTYIIDNQKHDVKIYIFSSKAFLLIATDHFNNLYYSHLEEIGGYWNQNLKLDDGKVQSGWLFQIEKDTQSILFGLLKKIHLGEIKPKKDNSDMMEKCTKLFGDLSKIFDQIEPDVKDVFSIPVLTDTGQPEGETIFYFNRDDDERAKGNCVINLEKNRKRLEIFQFTYA